MSDEGVNPIAVFGVVILIAYAAATLLFWAMCPRADCASIFHRDCPCMTLVEVVRFQVQWVIALLSRIW